MRIAQVAPLIESVPPRLYGGTERVVFHLTEELARQGHEVTLFASGDSRTRARLVPCTPRALRLDPLVREPLPHQLLQLTEVRRQAHRFDVIHFHTDLLHCPLFEDIAERTVTTLHGRLDLPDLQPFYRVFGHMPLVSISDAQRAPMPPVNWVGTVHHGLPLDLYRFRAVPADYVAFLGRISPEKRPDRAVEIARRAGVPLRVAAKVDVVDREYFHTRIESLLALPQVTFLGEIGESRKGDFLGGARALLCPVDWPEPFGLVIIEAMACGTPVIAFRNGSVPELVEHGVTGFVVDSIEGAADAVHAAVHLDRRQIRRRFEERFSIARMAHDYVAVYRCLVEGGGPTSPPELRRWERDR